MKLYYSPGACSLSPHIVAREAGIALELKPVDLKKHELARGGDFYAVSPKGYVPVLELDDGERLSAADAYLFTPLNWAGWTGVDLGRWPALESCVARLAARPKVQEALKAEGLVK